VTILFGVSCDDGVILATDSVRVVTNKGWGWPLHPPPTTLGLEVTARKIGQLGDRFVFAASGGGFRREMTGVGVRALTDLDELAPALFAEVERSVAPLIDDPLWIAAGKPEHDDVQLLVGGGRAGVAPGLVFVRRRYALASGTPAGPVELTNVRRGDFVARGVAEPWASAVGLEVDMPTQVAEAEPVVVALCHACVAYWRLHLGGVSVVAFPLQVAVITSARSSVRQVSELSPVERRIVQLLQDQGAPV